MRRKPVRQASDDEPLELGRLHPPSEDALVKALARWFHELPARDVDRARGRTGPVDG
ncbi:MAG: hypothetical protein H6736_18370 [Alphaproteobacteria bacterium]|nr:hypothetical protein [Alphaproteobacteria bacterium]MCB9693781.1 hypothetical protein [Alphaproteobacteria bacterium]